MKVRPHYRSHAPRSGERVVSLRPVIAEAGPHGNRRTDYDEDAVATAVCEPVVNALKACPFCGREIKTTIDGRRKKHRPVADTFSGPHCEGSGGLR